jgi:hypothetical protein
MMQDIKFPDFNKNRHIDQQKVLEFDNDNVKYKIILGTNLLSKTGIKLNNSEGNMEWFDCSIPLGPAGGLDSNKFDAMEDMFHIQVKAKLFGEDWLQCFATEILDANREDVVAELILMVNPLYHIMSVAMLNYEWCLALRSVLGTSGVWPK